MEGKGMVNIILFVIIGILSVTLCAVVIGFFVLGGGGNTSTPQASVIIIEKNSAPTAEELSAFYPYGSGEGEEASQGDAKTLSLKSDEDGTAHVMLLNMKIDYFKTVAGVESTAVLMEESKSEIKSTILKYFRSKTVEDISEPEAIEQAEKVLKKEFNHLLDHSGQNKEVVYKVIIDDWFVQ